MHKSNTKMKKFILIICAFAFVLSGCSYIIEITYENNDSFAPTFHLKEKHIIFGKAPRVREISFFKVIDSKPDYSNPIWSIKADGMKLKELTYGTVPKGFEAITPAKKLSPTTTYHVLVRAWGSDGFMDFETPRSST